MASKRAVQFIAPRVQSISLRAQCASVRASKTPCRSQNTHTRNFVTVRRQTGSLQVGFVAVQKRWHSGFPQDRKSKLYKFEDVLEIVENPSDSTILIDVREPTEHSVNTIPLSYNIPVVSQPDALLLPEEEFEDRFGFQKPPTDKEVVFFCKAGVRSAAAAQLAKQAGYKNVGEYKGSFLDWERRGGPGTKSPPSPGERTEP